MEPGSEHARRRVLGGVAALGAFAVTGVSATSVGAARQDSRTAWTATLDAGVGSVSVNDGVVVAETDDALHAFDAASGDTRFTYTDDYYRSYLDRGRPFASTSEGAFRRLSATSGEQEWTVDIGNGVNLLFGFTPDAVFAADAGEAMVCLDAADGTTLWRTDDDYGAIPAGIHDNVAVAAFASEPNIAAGYDVETGDRLYGITHDTSYNAYSLQDGYLVARGSEPTVTHVWDAATGENLWEGDGYYFLGSLDGAFFAIDRDGVHRIDTDTWESTWTVQDAQFGFLTGVHDEVAYFSGNQGAGAVSLDGTPQWTHGDPDGLAVAAPAESGVYYRNAASVVHLGFDGSEQWTMDAPSTETTGGLTNTGVSADYLVTGTSNGRVLAYEDAFSYLDATSGNDPGGADTGGTTADIGGTTADSDDTGDASSGDSTTAGETTTGDPAAEESSGSSPGFGVIATAVSLLGAVLATVRSDGDAD